MKNYYAYAVMALLLIGVSCKKDDDSGVVEINVPPSAVSVSSVISETIEGTMVKVSWEAATDQNNDPIVYDVVVNDKIVANKTSETSVEFDVEEFIPVAANIQEKAATITKYSAKGVTIELAIVIKAYDNNSAVSKEIEIVKSISVNRIPEAFEFINIDFGAYNYNYLSISWTPGVDPDGDVLSYNIYLNDELISEDYVIGSDDTQGYFVYEESFHQYINEEISIKVVANDNSGGLTEIIETFNFVGTDVDLEVINTPYNESFDYSTIEEIDQRVRYHFTINSASNYDFEITFANHDTYLYLYDIEGNLIDSDDDGGGIGNLSKMIGELDAGSYYIDVAGFSSTTGVGTLSVDLQ